VIVRCFEGHSVPEVMERVRRELGEDVVILHTQQRKGLWAWLRRLPMVRVWVALSTPSNKERWVPETTPQDGAPLTPQATSPSTPPSVRKRKTSSATEESSVASLAPRPSSRSKAKRQTRKVSREEPSVPVAPSPLERQLQLLTAVLWRQEGAFSNMSAISALWQCGVDLETLQALHLDAPPPQEADLYQWLHQILRVHMKVADGIAPTTKVAVLVGPTGVGKTTTVAKIAANEWMRRSRRVALVTVDVFRIGAVQQLETYARLMGLPFFVATLPEEAERCIRQAQKVADLVLVDTIGRSPKHDEQLSALWELVAAMNPDEVHLTLPANGNPSDLNLAAERFSLFCPTHLIITKLDEATQPGVMVNLSHRLHLPIAYLTVGQSVPDDLEIPTPDRLASWVLSPLRSGRPSAEVTGDA